MRMWWRLEAWREPTWVQDSWKRPGFYRPRVKILNRAGPPPHALSLT